MTSKSDYYRVRCHDCCTRYGVHFENSDGQLICDSCYDELPESDDSSKDEEE